MATLKMARERGHWMWVAVCTLGSLYIGSTLLTPLYPLYRKEFGFSELAVTEIYAAYALGNLAALFWFGRLSDQLGRRRTALAALAVTAASVALFLLARSTGWLFAARILNGVGAGVGAGAITAWIAELEPNGDKARAAVVASSGNVGGLAFGALLSGFLAEHGPWPLRLGWAIFLAILLAAFVGMALAPETVRHTAKRASDLSLKPRIGVPAGIRIPFISPAAMALATFALGGFYASLIPGLLMDTLHQSDLAVIGGLSGAFFGVACVAAASTGAMGARAAMISAVALMLPGLAMLVAAEALASMALLVGATVLGGAGMALGYRASLQIVNVLAPEAKRAEVVSTYLLVCYLGNGLPVLGVGLLSESVGGELAHRIFAATLAVLACIAAGVAWRYVKEDD
jgi:MFS family permease